MPRACDEGFLVCLSPSSSFNHQKETVKFVLDLLGLYQGDEIASSALHMCLARPASGQEVQLLHCDALLVEIRLMKWLLRHAGEHRSKQDCPGSCLMARIVLDCPVKPASVCTIGADQISQLSPTDGQCTRSDLLERIDNYASVQTCQ